MESATALIFFTRSEKAIKAKEELLFTLIRGREMGLAHYDRIRVKQEQANIFVKGLDSSDTNMSLYNLFKTYGEIFSSKLAQDSKGRSKGYGFVQYTSPETAAKVVSEFNEKEHGERKLLVAPYRRRDRSSSATFNNLYIKNLPQTVTTKEALDSLFAPFGERISVGIGQSSLNGKTGYFGFVCFKDPSAASNAVKEMNGKEIDGMVLCVTKALNKEQREREKRRAFLEYREKVRRRTLYLKSMLGIPLDEVKIKEELEPFGPIKVTIQKTKDENGEAANSPVGFVVFDREQDMQKALTEYVGDNRVLVISKLERKEDRRARLNRERMARQNVMGRGRNIWLEDFYREVYRHLNEGARMAGEPLIDRRYTNYVLGVGQRAAGFRHRLERFGRPYNYFNRPAVYGQPWHYR